MKIGIDLGGTKTEGILIDSKGKEIKRKRINTEKNYKGTIKGILDIVLLIVVAGTNVPLRLVKLLLLII